MKRYALITGTSSGLGYEMALYLLEQNYIVFGASRSGTDINHEKFIDIEVDVADEDSVGDMFDQIGSETYGIDLIVNNAGIFEMSSIEETSSKDFLEHFKINTLGVFHILKYAQEFLIENQSHVINISSIAAKKGFPNVSAYCASKFALNGLIESVREEWKSMGIRFSNLLPGAIDTPLWESISDEFERSKMLDIDDFIHIFAMVVNSSSHMQFDEINFLHKSGAV